MSETILKTSSIKNQTDEHKVFETPEEQILHRPGMWIGSTKNEERSLYLYDIEDGFVDKLVDFNAGIAKLIEEVIVNSADEHGRTKKNPKLRGWVLDKIKVNVQPDGYITVTDNGGISIYKHSTLGTWSIENIFGKLFSSSNYDDDAERTAVGTNGVGASLANLFSKTFTVHTADSIQQMSINWSNNKNDKSINEPIKAKNKEHFTTIAYQLELSRFGLEEIPYGVIKYIEKLCMILAASYPGLEVTFNDEVFKFKSFKDYVMLYGDEILYGEKNEHWEVYVAPTYGEPARRFGIVNGAECNSGTHIKMINQIVNHVLEQKCSSSKPKISNLTSNQLQAAYHAYVNITVDKPEYTSQAKTELSTSVDWYDDVMKKKRWLKLNEKIKKTISESDIFIYLKELASQKENAANSKEFQNKAKELNKKSAKNIRKLLDAGISKASERKNCELWIFEGESAGSGFRSNRYDPQYQGCYLLRGKVSNTADMGTLKVLDNQEISDIVVGLGLDVRNPSDLSKLRYGKIIFCTDMDFDGDSIIGQLLALFATHFPDLIKQGLVYRAISPLYKATRKKELKYFYTKVEFDTWSKAAKGWEIDYFKGIGSLEKGDYKELLSNTKLQRFNFDESTMHMIGVFMKKAPHYKKELKMVLKDKSKFKIA
jgi:DNA gyrase/topoisomerase IV subunit B